MPATDAPQLTLKVDQRQSPEALPELRYAITNKDGDSWTLARVRGTPSLGFAGSLSLETAPPAAAPGDATRECLRIDQDGRVGIGTEAPAARLDVNGSARVRGGLAVTGALGVGRDTPRHPLDVAGEVNATAYLRDGQPLIASRWSEVPGGIVYTAGRVGIGTAAPAAGLDVAGDARVGGDLAVAGQLHVAGDLAVESKLGIGPTHTFIKRGTALRVFNGDTQLFAINPTVINFFVPVKIVGDHQLAAGDADISVLRTDVLTVNETLTVDKTLTVNRQLTVSHISADAGHFDFAGIAQLTVDQIFVTDSLEVRGPLTVTGAKSAVVPHPDGSHRRLYALESPESWFEDFGTARLREGRAEVVIDPEFAALVREDGYQVFLTPYGECRGLYVSGRGPAGFTVRELQGGTSGTEFGYRVLAKRRDVEAPRLERVALPEPPPRPGGPSTPRPVSA